MLQTTDTTVLITGGGITGLSTALFLAWHDVSCLLVERHADLLAHPRARGFTPRTVEAYRQVGLEPAIRKATFAGAEHPWTAVHAETLAGDHTAVEEPEEDDGSAASPSSFAPIDQDVLETLVRDRARELGAEITFGAELTSFRQDDDGVRATVAVGGVEHTVRAAYLVAADGASSRIRGTLGIELDGPGALYDTLTSLVEADLAPALCGRRVSIAYLQRPRPFTVLLAHDDAGRRWVFGTGYRPDDESVADYTEARVTEMVRTAAGLPDVEVRLHAQIPGTDQLVLGFPIAGQLARQYRQGRVFLVGDAAHAVPPTGGLGANTGIQDAHNLAWKISAVTRGHAGAALLDTYHDERHPTGLLTMRQALARFGTRMADTEDTELLPYAAVTLGYQYRSTAVLDGAGDTHPLSPDELTGQPGTRAPHRALSRSDGTCSTLDRYGHGLVLLTGSPDSPWTSAAERLPVPVTTFGLAGDDGGSEPLAAAHGIGTGGALLVRPDGFVAWRARTVAAEPAAVLAGAVDAVLARRAT